MRCRPTARHQRRAGTARASENPAIQPVRCMPMLGGGFYLHVFICTIVHCCYSVYGFSQPLTTIDINGSVLESAKAIRSCYTADTTTCVHNVRADPKRIYAPPMLPRHQLRYYPG